MSKILVVDDSIRLTELMASALTGMGHKARVVNSTKGAFEIAKKMKPDIVILDVMLQDGTGYEVARSIRRDPELYRLAILYASSLSGEPEIKHAIEQGGDAYLTKPFTVPQLKEKLASLGTLQQSLAHNDRVTGLPGGDAMRREVGHHIAREEPFALAYVHIERLRAHTASSGKAGRRRALKRTAELLTQLIRTSGFYESYISYMGSGYFCVLMNLEDAGRFSRCLVEKFDQSAKDLVPEDRGNDGHGAVSNGARHETSPPLALRGCVVRADNHRFQSAGKVFDVVRRAYESVEANGHSVVVVDGN